MTAVTSSRRLDAAAGVQLLLKCENFQKTGSFKVRGALNKLLRLGEPERRRGVVTVSAGNHAQALAWAASIVGTRATVVMPQHASRVKAEASAAYGAVVERRGTTLQAFDHAHRLAIDSGLIFVHPFDDDEIMAGAGTVALEILEQVDDVDAIVVPVGGGGLIGGIASAVKAVRPHVRVYGVEPRGAAAMRASLDAGRPVRLEHVDTIADGLAPPMAGTLTYDVVRAFVDDVVLVSDDEIAAAMRLLITAAKLVTEPAGAAAVAALLARKIELEPDTRVVALLSGGNVDLHELGKILHDP